MVFWSKIASQKYFFTMCEVNIVHSREKQILYLSLRRGRILEFGTVCVCVCVHLKELIPCHPCFHLKKGASCTSVWVYLCFKETSTPEIRGNVGVRILGCNCIVNSVGFCTVLTSTNHPWGPLIFHSTRQIIAVSYSWRTKGIPRLDLFCDSSVNVLVDVSGSREGMQWLVPIPPPTDERLGRVLGKGMKAKRRLELGNSWSQAQELPGSIGTPSPGPAAVSGHELSHAVSFLRFADFSYQRRIVFSYGGCELCFAVARETSLHMHTHANARGKSQIPLGLWLSVVATASANSNLKELWMRSKNGSIFLWENKFLQLATAAFRRTCQACCVLPVRK